MVTRDADDDEVSRDMDLIGNEFPDQGNDDVGEEQDEGKSTAHTDRILQRSACCQGGTNTQELDKQRVFFNVSFVKSDSMPISPFR